MTNPITPPATAWTQSKGRVAFHEVGHAAVDYVLVGMTAGCVIGQLNGEWIGESHPLPVTTPFAAMPRGQSLAYLAGLWGGWAAVHLAIATGLLPAEPQGIEAVPVDRGYYGAGTSDDFWVRAVSTIAQPGDPASIADEARRLALATLAPRMQDVGGLASRLAKFGLPDPAEIAAALR